MDRDITLQQLLQGILQMDYNITGRASQSARTQMSTIHQNISNPDEAVQMAGLMELCDQLNMATQDTLIAIQSDLLVPAILKCLNKDAFLELTLAAARALTYLVDAIQLAAYTVAANGGIPILLERLRNVVDVELSEQCLTCLEKVAPTQSTTIIKEGGIEAMLSFVDFFTSSTQRKAWNCVAGLCKLLSSRQFQLIQNVLPQIHQTLRSEDNKVRESCMRAFCNLLQCFSTDSERVAELFGDCTATLLNAIEKRSDDDTFSLALQAIKLGVQHSDIVEKKVVNCGAVDVLLSLISTPGTSNASAFATPALRPTTLSAVTSPVHGAMPMGMLPPPLHNGDEAAAPANSTGPTPPSAGTAVKPLRPELAREVCLALTTMLPLQGTHFQVARGQLRLVQELELLKGTPTTPHGGGGVQLHGRAESTAGSEEVPQNESDKNGSGNGDDEDEAGGADDHEGGNDAPHDEEANEEVEDEDEWESVNEFDVEDEMPAPTLSREEVLNKLEEMGVVLETDSRHANCNLNTHICDSCGKSCNVDSWFRCNQCSDFDLCGPCLIEKFSDHEDHVFCDMAVLVSTRSQGGAAAPNVETIKLVDAKRIEMFKETPYILERVLTVLPMMVQMHNSTEDPVMREASMAFLVSAVGIATGNQLLQAGIASCPICELLSMALRDGKDMVSVASAMYIVGKLIGSLGPVFQPLFAREGIIYAMDKVVSSSYPERPREKRDANDGKPGAQRNKEGQLTYVASASDDMWPENLLERPRMDPLLWQTILRKKSEAIVAAFPSILDKSVGADLEGICAQLRSGLLGEAFRNFRDLLAKDVSAFQLASCGVVQELLDALVTANSADAVVELVATLSEELPRAGEIYGAPDGDDIAPCAAKIVPLARLVQYLQAMLNYSEAFTMPQFPNIQGRPQISVKLIEHVSPIADEASPTVRPDSSGSVRTVARMRERPKRPVAVLVDYVESVGRIADYIAESIYGRPKSSPPSTAFAASHARQQGGNRSAVGASASASEEDEGDEAEETDNRNAMRVEDVLPELANEAQSAFTSRKKSRLRRLESTAPETNAAPRGEDGPSASQPGAEGSGVYLRLGNQELHRDMTLAYVWMQYAEGKQYKSSLNRMFAALPSAASELHSLLGIKEELLLTIHYSSKPFDSPVRPPPSKSCTPIGSPGNPIRVVLPSESPLSAAERSVMRAVHASYPFSSSFLSPKIRTIITLLGILHEALRHWHALLAVYSAKTQGTSSISGASLSAIPESVLSPSVHMADFTNVKLNSKVVRQSIQRHLSGHHHNWWAVNLAMDCNFLFTEQTRAMLLDISFTGPRRSMNRMNEHRTGIPMKPWHNLTRRKLRVWRDKPLQCALKCIGSPSPWGLTGWENCATMLEFEFYGENGSGLGPTLEFYSLVAAALRERKLSLWRSGSETAEDVYYRSESGLYPRPMPPEVEPSCDSNSCTQEVYFHFIGSFLGRALLDKRVPSLDLSLAMIKMIRMEECTAEDINSISRSVGGTLAAMCAAARMPDANGGLLNLHSAPDTPDSPHIHVGDLMLDFTLPGDDSIELVPNGASIAVTKDNMLEYCDAVVRYMLCTGVERNVQALRRGFNDVFPIQALRLLTVDEVHDFFVGYQKPISLEEFASYCVADHGYTLSSAPVQALFQILASFTLAEQRQFFEFLTGSPHLPVGGLASLQPRITIVRKTSSEAGIREEDQLPSAMTCQNYLKLPAYSSREKMEKKLRQAISDGCGAFLLT